MIALQEGEKIVAEVRKHWWRLFVLGFGLSISAVLPILLLGVLLSFSNLVLEDKIIYFIGFFYSLWLTALWLIFFVEWTDYYLDVWIVTNQRIVDIDQAGLFSRNLATVRLDDIEDIVCESTGIIQTLLKFGRLTIQTAGSRNEFYIKNARNPELAKQMIYGLIHEARNKITVSE